MFFSHKVIPHTKSNIQKLNLKISEFQFCSLFHLVCLWLSFRNDIRLTISRTKTCCRRFPFRNNSDFLHLIDQLDPFFCSNSCLSSACLPNCLNHHIRFYIQQWVRAALFLGCFFHLSSSAWTLLNIKTQFLRARESVDYEIFILHLRWCSSDDFPFSYICPSSRIFFLAVK